MKKNRTKGIFLAAFAVALVFSVGTGYSATMSISGPTEVLPGDSFTIDVLLDDVGSIGTSLADVDFWNLGLQIYPVGMYDNADFIQQNVTTSESDFIFFGRSFAYDILVESGGITVKASDAATGPNADPGSLLSKLRIDVDPSAVFCEYYEVGLIEVGPATWNFVGNSAGDIDSLGFDTAAPLYKFHVVPIPGAFWLLGSGIFGLLALRRRKK
jgi:hypothetical protein